VDTCRFDKQLEEEQLALSRPSSVNEAIGLSVMIAIIKAKRQSVVSG
jgi:hypothetical protein